MPSAIHPIMASTESATSAAPTSAPGMHPKHYVFVDEYNRHKRLKVMRACDGCRKRKIRCDGALQNGPWPCGACVRLKLRCIPPSLDPDDELQAGEPESGQSTFQTTFQPQNNGRPPDTTPRAYIAQDWPATTPPSTTMPTPVSMEHQSLESDVYPANLFHRQLGSRLDRSYADDDYLASAGTQVIYTPTRPEPRRSLQTQTSMSSNDDPEEVEATVRELENQMGDLTIDHLSVAPWVANQNANFLETPTQEDADILLPPSVNTNPAVHIPPEMMPTDARCMDYFGYFFTYIHPYVPVLSRKLFYNQWRTARDTISPLLLEAIFACVARYLEETVDVRRWLALAARHEESFKDVPRLSTIQALLLLTKAREFVPKRGYYYRSWMSVKYMTTMAMDLELNAHCDKHRLGNSCKLERTECLVRTRIWQTLFQLELLVGAPQGRTDFTVELETVDLTLPTPSPNIDSFEYTTSRRTTLFAQCMRNIKITNRLWQLLRWQKKDWALDPSFLRHNEDLTTFLPNLPVDVQIDYTDDGTPPFLKGDHFAAYLHIYHHLIVIMHHRPQLQTLLERRDPSWRQQLDICLQAGMRMCQLQEALMTTFGIHGLQFMTRGINFSIYCVLSCTMLHLAAITSPDPDTNMMARTYFTRHMRVLERCVPGATQDLQAQINALREAFSADTSKPFELKPTLGLRSPSMDSHPTPPSMQHHPPIQTAAAWSQVPDVSAMKTNNSHPEYHRNPYDSMVTRSPYPATTDFSMPPNTTFATPLGQVTSAPQQNYGLDGHLPNEQTTPVWDPSGIFNHWNTAFGSGSQLQAPQQPHGVVQDVRLQAVSASMLPQQQHPLMPATSSPHQPLYNTPQTIPLSTNPTATPSPSVSDSLQTALPTVTPHMWQDVFTNAYVSAHGQKRYREEDFSGVGGGAGGGMGGYDGIKRRG